MTEDIENAPDEPISSGRKADGKFAKGNNANPAGRPVGARNKHLVAVENLLDGEAERLSRKVIDLALEGDTTCLRICMERILPPRKDRPLSMELPRVSSMEDIATAMGAVVEHVAEGAITPSEGATMASLLQGYAAAIESTDVLKRLQILEEQTGLS